MSSVKLRQRSKKVQPPPPIPTPRAESLQHRDPPPSRRSPHLPLPPGRSSGGSSACDKGRASCSNSRRQRSGGEGGGRGKGGGSGDTSAYLLNRNQSAAHPHQQAASCFAAAGDINKGAINQRHLWVSPPRPHPSRSPSRSEDVFFCWHTKKNWFSKKEKKKGKRLNSHSLNYFVMQKNRQSCFQVFFLFCRQVFLAERFNQSQIDQF